MPPRTLGWQETRLLRKILPIPIIDFLIVIAPSDGGSAGDRAALLSLLVMISTAVVTKVILVMANIYRVMVCQFTHSSFSSED